MASRSLLHKNKLSEFKSWCEANGFECRDGRGDYQVLQVKVDAKWHVVYARNYMPEHLTVPRPLINMVNKFMREKK